MEASQVYILISIAVLLIIFILFVFVKKNKRQKITFRPLTGLAFAFVITGIVVGNDRLIGYGLMGE